MRFMSSELEGCPYKEGDTMCLSGEITYWQDFSWWRNKFPFWKKWIVEGFCNGSAVLASKGYGLKPKYGNGSIYVDPKYLPQIKGKAQ